MDFLSKNKIIVAAAAIVIAGVLWYGFRGSSSSTAILGTENPGGEVNSEDADIIATLQKLEPVKLSGTIFSSPVFLILQDYSTEITQEPVGRADPFAPLSAPAQTAPASGSNSAGASNLFSKPR